MYVPFKALVSVSEEVRSRCHVKHTIPRWPPTESVNDHPVDSTTGNQNVRRQKSWDMLDQSAIAYARQQHKVQHQVIIFNQFILNYLNFLLHIFEFPIKKTYIVYSLL